MFNDAWSQKGHSAYIFKHLANMGLLKYGCMILLLGLGLQMLKTYVNGGVCQSKARIDGKVVVITGANTGLGKTTAEELARRGGTIILACRDVHKGAMAVQDVTKDSDIDPKKFHVMELDLASFASVRKFVGDFKKEFDRLDILINNAAVLEPPYGTTEDGFEQTIGINYFGHFLLTNLLMDYITKSSPSRIINLTSNIMDTDRIDLDNLSVSKEKYDGRKAYAQSKLAIVLFTRELGRRLQGSGITTYSVHPGIIITDIVREWPLQQTTWGRTLMYWGTWWFTKDVTAGIQTVLCCSVDDELPHETGEYYSDCARGVLPNSAFQDNDAKTLWERSFDLVQLKSQEIHPLLR